MSWIVPSSSRTLSPIVTLVSWLEYCKTIILVSSIPSLRATKRQLAIPQIPSLYPYRSATCFASSGWLFPVKSLTELAAMVKRGAAGTGK